MTAKKRKKISKKEQEELNKIGMNFLKLREDYPMPNDKIINQTALVKKIKEQIGIELQNTRISAIENCNSRPTFKEILAYNKFFDAPIEYLIGFTDSREYENIKVNQEYGLNDEALQTIINIKNHKMVGNALNEFLNKDNGTLFEAILYNINLYVNLSKQKISDDEKFKKAKEIYSEKTGKPINKIDDSDIKTNLFIMDILNPLSTEQNKIIDDLILIKFKINEHISSIINNILGGR